jgi:MOSC domain-containing protein
MGSHLGRIVIFPFKSLDGVSIPEARITPGGCLEHDRAYMIVDAQGRKVNGKREAKVHRLRSRFDPGYSEIEIWPDGGRPERFALAERAPLDRWLSDYFGYAVAVRHDPVAGFPDDHEAYGPTVVSVASLEAIATWYPGLNLDSVRRRFRANLELEGEGMAPFFEDSLFGAAGELKPFAIGPVRFCGHNPCQRCVVPTRDPDSGDGLAGFQKEFMERRRKTLPPWANATRFNHFYRFALNTSIPLAEAAKVIRVGDALDPAPGP